MKKAAKSMKMKSGWLNSSCVHPSPLLPRRLKEELRLSSSKWLHLLWSIPPGIPLIRILLFPNNHIDLVHEGLVESFNNRSYRVIVHQIIKIITVYPLEMGKRVSNVKGFGKGQKISECRYFRRRFARISSPSILSGARLEERGSLADPLLYVCLNLFSAKY